MVSLLERPQATSHKAVAMAFTLPDALEAREPPEARGLERDQVRLLVSYRADDRTEHALFHDIAGYLAAGDLVVVNDSATIPAALRGTREDGSDIALHLSTRRRNDVWVVEPRETAGRAGERIALAGGGVLRLEAPYRSSTRLWLARLTLPKPAFEYLSDWGQPIRYKYVTDDWPIEMYQTVYARRPGSAEMPSAGRAFSRRVIASLQSRGVGLAAVTLHTGVASLEEHEPPFDEWFEVSPETADAIRRTRLQGGRVVAVGTTVVRALESAVDGSYVVPQARWTDLVITPDHPLRAVDALLTGFHEPRASHLSMLEAIAGRHHLEVAYETALEGGYLWHEFGDLHLIL
ncbi:MAG: S-adenosylmethionine:tRNA ribosyltransferase-isomerase [Dehalococcoidia bacterium]